ncbi:MAG: phage tail tape measure protein, partial [Lachnospiraceae bacterium]|nr:phage tail tape measure protein [Lachnospiraceae bacterium]
MAYDDSLNIDARIDQTGVESGMSDMAKNVQKGMNAVSVAAGQELSKMAEKVGSTFADMLKSGDEYNKAMNQLAASTGATGEELEELKEVAKDVFSNNYGESYEDVANAVANVKKQLGDLSNDELQAITESAFALSDVFEYDVAESTRAAKAMVDNFGISGEYAMELIATGAQNGLDYSGELIDSISEYSVQFAKVGLDADDMFAIFQQGAENGAWNLDKVGDAVKEFSIRSIDGSDTTAAGFAAIGLNADEMARKFT